MANGNEPDEWLMAQVTLGKREHLNLDVTYGRDELKLGEALEA